MGNYIARLSTNGMGTCWMSLVKHASFVSHMVNMLIGDSFTDMHRLMDTNLFQRGESLCSQPSICILDSLYPFYGISTKMYVLSYRDIPLTPTMLPATSSLVKHVHSVEASSKVNAFVTVQTQRTHH